MPAKRHRVTRGDDYRRIVRGGIRVPGTLFVTHALAHAELQRETPARFGFIVSQAIGNAVTRNLVRRRLKALVERQLALGFSSVDIVFRALPASATASFSSLQHEMEHSLAKVDRRFKISAPSEDRVQ